MSNTSKWKLSDSEIARSAGPNNSKAKIFKVHIAKILPLVKFGTPKIKKVPISKKCFLNAKGCKISIQPRVRSANYILVPKSNASRLSGSIKHGTKLKVSVFNGNVDKLAVISKRDSVINN